VWIISRHYSDDQRMGSLFQRIAREIGDRIESAVDLRHIFRMSSSDAVELLKVRLQRLRGLSHFSIRDPGRREAAGCGGRWPIGGAGLLGVVQ
jgi:dynein heavy chain